MPPKKKSDFQWIAVWDEMLGGYAPYTDAQQTRAAKEDAPLTATYRGFSGQWHTVEDITSPSARERIEVIAKRRGFDLPVGMKTEWAKRDKKRQDDEKARKQK